MAPFFGRRGLLLAGVVSIAVNGFANEHRAVESARRRVIVQFSPALAAEIAALLPESASLEAAGARGEAAQLVAQHRIRSMRPLHSGLVRGLKRSGQDDRAHAEAVRQRFARRSARATAKFDPPALSQTYVLELEAPDTRPAVLAALGRDPRVVWAEPDRVVSVALTPNDPHFHTRGSWGQSHDDLYGIKNIGSAQAWDQAKGDDVVVAVVDTGLDYGHPDTPRLWINRREYGFNGVDDDRNGYVDDVFGWDFAYDDNDPTDREGHGTHVAGTVAAAGNNHLGVIGVAWRAQIMALQGLDASGQGTASDLAAALVYAADNGADIVNCSWGGPERSQAIGDAIAHAYRLGVVLVVAAGNDGIDALDLEPAGRPEVITVAAVDAQDRLAGFSNRGPKIDVGAPGVDILSLRAEGSHWDRLVGADYAVGSGTSMAAPHVAGVAALLLSKRPTYTNEQVRQALRASAVPSPGHEDHDRYGYGRLNAGVVRAAWSPLEVKLLQPVARAAVSSPVQVYAIARGPSFHRYVLEYGAGTYPASWTFITAVTGVPAHGGLIGTFAPAGTPEGPVTLRLTAENTQGQTFVDQVTIEADYVAITSPAPPEDRAAATVFKPGVVIPIQGRAAAPGFRYFSLDWAPGVNPTEGWSPNGMTLTNGGTSPVPDGAVGSWNTTGIVEAGYYTIRLRVDDGGTLREARTVVYLEPDLLGPGWPIAVAGAWGTTVAAFDAPRGRSLALVTQKVATSEGRSELRFFSPAGEVWMHMPVDRASRRQPAAGPFDDAAGAEVLVPYGNAGVLARSEGGEATLRSPSENMRFTASVAQLADLDEDGRLEALTAAGSTTSDAGALLSWRSDGTPFAPPIPFSDRGRAITGQRGFLAADFDGDGRMELLVKGHASAGTLLRRYDAGGRAMPFVETDLQEVVDLAAGDLDRDGTLEIVVTGRRDTVAYVEVFGADGRRRPGWPKTLDTAVSLALGDIDGNGAIDVVVAGEQRVHAWRGDGTSLPGWPVYTGANVGRLAIADVGGNRRPEVLIPTAPALDGVVQLTVLSADGRLHRVWELPGHGGKPILLNISPTVADIDGDGRTDIAVVFQTREKSDPWRDAVVLTVLATGAPHRPAPGTWPMPFADAYNSSVAETPGRPTLAIAEPAIPAQYSAGETITFSGTAADAEDGTLPATAYTWRVTFHNGPTVTQVLGPLTGVRTGSFTVPTVGDAATDVFYRIQLTVRDSSGLPRATYRDVRPRISRVTLATVPPGLPLAFDGQPARLSPVVFDSVVGQRRTITAAPTVSSGGGTWELVSWSDSGAPAHAITVPASATALTASYRLVSPTPTAPTGTTHDFNGDASADIVWRNRVTGANGYWYVDGEQYFGAAPFYAEASRDWDIVASSDFDGDRKMDLVWSHRTTGELGIWFMDGVVRVYAAPMRTMEPGWSVEGAGDFDGDGKADLLIRRARDGQLGIWYMDGLRFRHGALIPSEAGANWIVGGVGDFNGDRKPDIVLRNVQTGVIGVWLMNDTARTGIAVFDNPGLAWAIVQVGDYDGDSDADLLWRNATTGANGIWLMNGTAFSRAVSLPSVGGTDWEVK